MNPGDKDHDPIHRGWAILWVILALVATGAFVLLAHSIEMAAH